VKTVEQILADIAVAAKAAQPFVAGNPTAAAIDSLAGLFATIAQNALAGYEKTAGEPLDLSKLQPIDPVE
jgi:hypothetical protein